MSVEIFTLDTNILVYAFDAQAGARHKKAMQIIEAMTKVDCILTLQSLSEFFNITTRKKLLSIDTASTYVDDLQNIFPVAAAKHNALTKAIDMICNNRLSFWDAMLCATAQSAGVTRLLSEDFQHGQLLKGVRIINPFVPNKYWSI